MNLSTLTQDLQKVHHHPKNSYKVGNGGFLFSATPAGDIFTREKFNDEQLEIGKSIQEFIATKVIAQAEAIENKEKDADGKYLAHKLFQELGELGVYGIDIPEEYEGLDMDFKTTMYVSESIAGLSSFVVTCMAHMAIGTLPILFFGNSEQKKKYLPKLATGQWMSCYALTEPGSGSDALSGKTKAVLEGDHYVLNGSKQFISNGAWADVAIVFARIDGQYSSLIVELDQPGVTRGAEEKKTGLWGSSTTTLTFDNVKVPQENLLGKIGDASKIALNILNMGRMELGFASLGAMKDVVAKTLKYGKEREQFGRPILEFDMQLGKMGDIVARTFACDSALYRIPDLIDEKLSEVAKDEHYYQNLTNTVRSTAMEASIAKLLASEELYSISTEGVKMHGGYGYIQEYVVERQLRDSIIGMIYEGTNSINRLVVFDFLVRGIYSQALPFRTFVEEIEQTLRKKSFHYPDSSDILNAEKSQVYAAKYILSYLLNKAIIRYGKSISSNQQVIACLADIIVQVYTADSTLARVHYIIEQNHSNAENTKLIARYITARSMGTIQSLVPLAYNEIFEDQHSTKTEEELDYLCSLIKSKENLMRLKREIGRITIDKGAKVFNVSM